MLYFSELKNKDVFTEDDVYVGRLIDVVFTFKDVARVTKLLVKSADSRLDVHIPVSDALYFGEKVTITKSFDDIALEENELYVSKNLVDKQIIDIEGRKVVRVNDVLLQRRSHKVIFITGVDIGILAIFRWFRLEKSIKTILGKVKFEIKPRILSWQNIQPLELTEGKVVLNTQQEKLERFHPEDLADYLESTNIENTIKALDLVDREFASEVIAELNLNYQVALFEKISIKKAARIIEFMDPDEAVDILLQFTPLRRKKVLDLLPNDYQDELENLIKLSKTTVGQYMTSEFLYVFEDESVTQIREKILIHTKDFDFLFYIYVVNKQKQLLGVFSLHELFFQKQHTLAHQFMHTNLVLAYLNSPINVVIKRMITYKLYGLPVVSKSKKMLGIILLDDIDDILLHELAH